jgi:hypothetical protein
MEKDELVANCDRFKSLKHSSSLPYAFLESGVAMISTILKTPNTIRVSMQIIDAFVEMRQFLKDNANVFVRLENVERKQPKALYRHPELVSGSPIMHLRHNI